MKVGVKKQMTMKTINSFLLMVMAAAMASSCAEIQEDPHSSSDPENLIPMTFGAVIEENGHDATSTRTSYDSSSVLWEDTDAISVFFKGEGSDVLKQTFTISDLSEDKRTAVFEGLGTDKPYVAVYPDQESNAYNGTDVTVTIPSEQMGVANGFASRTNASVACSDTDTLLFRNVGSLIAFRFASQEEADEVASVTIRIKTDVEGEYVGISGSSSVAFLEGNIPAAGKGSADYVKVNAPEGGFVADGVLRYYAVVYPFKGSGLEVTLTKTDGQTVTLNNDSPASVARNNGLMLYTLSDIYKLPEEFDIKLNFSGNWPFEESILAAASQVTTGGGKGDKYTYEFVYEDEGKEYTEDLDFYIYGNGGNYTLTNILQMKSKNSRILLPAVPGRHLKSVKLEVVNGAAYPKGFNVVEMNWNSLVNAPNASNGSPAVVTFPYDMKRTEKNTSYYMQFSAGNTSVSAITLTYSRTLNGNNSSEPTGHFSLMQVSQAVSTQMMSYIMETENGKVFVIDGGNAGDAEKLKGILQEKYGNKVHIWWITHPHSDHIGALNEILDNMDGLTIDYIMHSRFSDKHIRRESSHIDLVTEFYGKLDALTSTTVIGNVDSGAHYDIDGVAIDILGVTNEDITVNVYNNSSMILRFEDRDKSVLFLADAGEECGDKAMMKYRDLLDCDYVQMAHHGQKGVTEEFYKTIDFSVCLWPTPKWLWDAAEGNANDWRTWETRRWMDEKGIQKHHKMWEEIDWFLE